MFSNFLSLEDHLGIIYGLLVATISSFCLLNCLPSEDMPFVCLAQLFWTVFLDISETQHSHLTHSD